jgi:flagellar biosynthesis protein FlhG
MAGRIGTPGARPSTAAAVDEAAARLRSGRGEPQLRRVVSRSIAVCSGKGGVGKTITACNLALSYARKGLRVGLVDLDPLSDVASLLDLQDSESAVLSPSGAPGASALFSSIVLPVFKSLEVLFPAQKLTGAAVGAVAQGLYGTHLAEIDRRYDILLFDMPAGMGYEDNLAYLPLMSVVVLVTNPEPTAHASAGAYAKEVQRLFPGTTIKIWHNRYSTLLKEGFHPSDVAGNYNRYVDPASKLTPTEEKLLHDFAFVPEDPSLDLLQGEPVPVLHALRGMRDGLDYAHGRLLSHAIKPLGLPPRVQEIVTSYVHRNPRIGGTEAYVASLASYIGAAAASPRKGVQKAGGPAPTAASVFSAPLAAALEDFLRRVRQSGLRREMLRLHGMLQDHIRKIEESRGPFATRLAPEKDAALDHELGRLLVILNRAARGSTLMRNQGVLLLFYFALHKLFQSRTLVGLIRALIPRRMGQRGRKVRDRFSQIRALVEGDPAYRERYLRTLRALHALVTQQVAAIARALDLGALVVVDGKGRIDAKPYLKLLSAFLHETVYSGLSVIIGFDYRSAAGAFQDAAERLLASLPKSA